MNLLAMSTAIVVATLAIAQCGGSNTGPSGGNTTPAVSGVVLTPASTAPGASVQGTVNLTAAAPAGGATVALSSTNPAVATVPGTAAAAAGSASASFTATAIGAGTTTITASLGTQSSATLTVTAPAIALAAISLTASIITGGNPVTGTVTLTGAAPAAGAFVMLSGADPVTVPASVTVPAGSTSATFIVATREVGTATLTTIAASFGGVTLTAGLTVLSTVPDVVTLRSISLNPASVVGGNTAQGTLTLDGPAGAGGTMVMLSSGTPSVATVPASVTIAPGSTSGTFTVSTSAVSSSASVVITGTYGATRTVMITVNP